MDTDREHSEQQTKQSRWGFRGMTVRNWLELLIVPLVLVGIGLLFENQQANRQQAMEEQQQALEERRAEAERELAEQRAQDEALQAYLDQMSGLLLERDLRTSEKDSEVRTLARARTLTVLGRLDPSHKTALMRFLVEADLVQRVDGTEPIIGLSGADLSGANLTDAADNLSGADLSSADLSGANLGCLVALGAHQRCSDLSGADLSTADLSGANLGCDWSVRRSSHTIFKSDVPGRRCSDLSGADLSTADLFGADLSEADLSDADLSEADLFRANLSEADLSDADLSEADLGGADLSGAVLENANLRLALGVTNVDLELQASLKGATMINGQKYEDWYDDWLKSQEYEEYK